MLRFNFQTITPLHITNGEKLGYNVDYLEKDGMFFKYDKRKISKYFAENDWFDFSKEYSYFNFIEIIEERKEQIPESLFEYSVNISSYALSQIRNEKAEGQNYVQEFINSNGKFYIPGSSVKGAIATALNQESLGIKNNISQKFVIQDSDFISDIFLQVEKTYKGRPPVQLLCLKPYSEFTLLVKKSNEFTKDFFIKKIREYYKKQLENSIAVIKLYKNAQFTIDPAEIYSDLLEEYLNVLSTQIDKDETLINIGFGSGAYFKIINDSKYFDDNYRGEKPHTTFSFYDGEYLDHIGWCKLKIEEE